jgi:hypothetical protein
MFVVKQKLVAPTPEGLDVCSTAVCASPTPEGLNVCSKAEVSGPNPGGLNVLGGTRSTTWSSIHLVLDHQQQHTQPLRG